MAKFDDITYQDKAESFKESFVHDFKFIASTPVPGEITYIHCQLTYMYTNGLFLRQGRRIYLLYTATKT